MTVTMVAAGLLGLLMAVLGIRVIAMRFNRRISLGTGKDSDLEKRIRVHGNAAEWVPIGLILLFLAEQAHGATPIVIGAAAALVIGRFAHPFGLRTLDPNIPRTAGMVLTIAAVLTFAALVLVAAVQR